MFPKHSPLGVTWLQPACLLRSLQAQHTCEVEGAVEVADKTLGQMPDAGLLCLIQCHARDIRWYASHCAGVAMLCFAKAGCYVAPLLSCWCCYQSYACLTVVHACYAAALPSHHQSAVRTGCQVCLYLPCLCCQESELSCWYLKTDLICCLYKACQGFA